MKIPCESPWLGYARTLVLETLGVLLIVISTYMGSIFALGGSLVVLGTGMLLTAACIRWYITPDGDHTPQTALRLVIALLPNASERLLPVSRNSLNVFEACVLAALLTAIFDVTLLWTSAQAWLLMVLWGGLAFLVFRGLFFWETRKFLFARTIILGREDPPKETE